ncbi:MAG: glutamine--fructose-6-phosphate transaminase (isomerizing), partial [Patescibacteria group bacterium]
MCGILAFVSKTEKENPAKFLLDGLKRLEYRGYDSWGIAYGVNPILAKRAGRISGINAEDFVNQPSLAGLGHTRWATHGGVTDDNAHPHTDCSGRIVVVHNGIVENWEELKGYLLEKGHLFKSETDTEVIAHLIEEEWESKDGNAESFAEAVRLVFNKLTGLNAIVAFSPQLGSIVGFRNGSPMVLGVGEGEHFIASDVPAFLPFTRKVSYLEDGEGVILFADKAEVFDAETGRRRAPKVEEISWDAGEAELGEYPHYLIKEISEQPQILSRLSKYPEKEIKEVAKLIKDSFGTYFTACGTAAHSGLAATYMFADLAKRHVNFSVGSEFPFLESFLTRQSLLIAASQSGETMDTLEAVRSAKKHRSKVVALTNVQGSSLTRVADKTILLNCGPEKAVLATKSYTAKLALFLLLASQIGRKGAEGRILVAKAARGVKEILAAENIKNVKDLAKVLKDSSHIYVIG